MKKALIFSFDAKFQASEARQWQGRMYFRARFRAVEMQFPAFHTAFIQQRIVFGTSTGPQSHYKGAPSAQKTRGHGWKKTQTLKKTQPFSQWFCVSKQKVGQVSMFQLCHRALQCYIYKHLATLKLMGMCYLLGMAGSLYFLLLWKNSVDI